MGGLLAPVHHARLTRRRPVGLIRHRDAMSYSSLVAAAALGALMIGCTASEDIPKLHAERHPIGTLGSGFVDAAAPPAPESTINPAPGSWDAVHPPRDYHVVLLTAGDDPATSTLVAGITQWANREHVRL